MMTRPVAIVRFERLWLASTAAWLVGAALSWGERRRMISDNPALGGYEWLVPAGFALVLAVSLCLWWLAAHRRRLMARTAVAGVAVLSAIVIAMTLIGMVTGRALTMPTNLLQLLSSALSIAAAASLFRADARPWFGEPALEVRP
jgi:hypothetical protein